MKIFLMLMVVLALPVTNSFAQENGCEEIYGRRPCDNNSPYTCTQKQTEMANCKEHERERAEAARKAKRERAEAAHKAKLDEDKRAQALERINEANRKVKEMQPGTGTTSPNNASMGRRDATNPTPEPAAPAGKQF